MNKVSDFIVMWLLVEHEQQLHNSLSSCHPHHFHTPHNTHTPSQSSHSSEPLEMVPLNPETVNQTSERIGPECFDLLKVLGKGGYGKVLSSTPNCLCCFGLLFIATHCIGISGQKKDRCRQRKDLCYESFKKGVCWDLLRRLLLILKRFFDFRPL